MNIMPIINAELVQSIEKALHPGKLEIFRGPMATGLFQPLSHLLERIETRTTLPQAAKSQVTALIKETLGMAANGERDIGNAVQVLKAGSFQNGSHAVAEEAWHAAQESIGSGLEKLRAAEQKLVHEFEPTARFHGVYQAHPHPESFRDSLHGIPGRIRETEEFLRGGGFTLPARPPVASPLAETTTVPAWHRWSRSGPGEKPPIPSPPTLIPRGVNVGIIEKPVVPTLPEHQVGK